jgi:UDP-glucose 4-epimerase
MTEVDCLVIGASGPIGQNLLAALSALNLKTLGVSRSTSQPVDISDPVQAETLLTAVKPRRIVYLATPKISELEGSVELVEQTAATVGGVASASSELGVEKFVFLSSASVYGTNQPEPLKEGDPLRGKGGYAESKIRSEAAIADAFAGSPTRGISLRTFNVYGPGCDQSLINRLGDPTTSVWDTDQFVRDYIHVDDVVAGIINALDYKGTGEAFNLGTGVGTSNRDLITMTQTWGAFRQDTYEGPPSFSIADTRLSKTELGFEARVELGPETARFDRRAGEA